MRLSRRDCTPGTSRATVWGIRSCSRSPLSRLIESESPKRTQPTKAGPSKLPRRNLNEDVSRNTPWNNLANTDTNEQTSQSITEFEVEQAGAPGMNEAWGIESTQVQKTSEPRNAEEKLLGLRRKRDELDEKERVVAVKLADLAEELRKVQKEKNACCSLARNEHTMQMLKAQFRAGIQEMDDMSEEDQESEDGHSRNRRDYESIDLPVFACSSRDYMRLTGQLQGDGEASCFSKLGDTGIPAVQKWCHDLTLGYRREAAEEFLTRLDDLTRNVKMYVEHMQNGYISGVNRNTVRSKWDSSIAVEGVSRRLKREFSVLAEKYISDLQKCFKDGLEEKLRAGAESAADLALDTIDRFGKIHHATYRATIRHYGCFKLGDLNFELVDPFTQSIAKSFSATFKKAILGRLDIRLRKVLTALLDEFQASVGPATGELSSLTKKQGGSCQTALKTVWQSTMASIDQTVSSKGKDISRSIAPIIQENLHFTYEEARDERGRGTTGRQKEHIRRFVEQNKDTMFQEVADDILKALDNIAAVIRGTLRRSLDSLADKIELRLAVLWEEVHTGADEKAAREKAMRLMTQIKDRISFYLHTPEDDPLQYEEDEDMDLF
ncbi:hypothetical protein DFP72DRAFT_484423 [Ephemerocybe angulata]|uniref:DUF7605 domain-containing protein n=1 Tax=Ephemerocybe angulata TaxID=980116 RepID=A0A8H6IGB3_9AGAR|nr:hypothetical protein DFP72DRAFT_484423 [Tulosesus angulatus]